MKIESKFDAEKMTIRLLKENGLPIVELNIYFWQVLSEFKMAVARSDKQLQDSGKLQS